MSTADKFVQLFLVCALFIGVMVAILAVANLMRSKRAEVAVGAIFIAPAIVMVTVGLLYPAIRTIFFSFRTGGIRLDEFAGFDNYKTIFTDPDQIVVLRNTALWVILVPIIATLIGLVYAILIDKTRYEKFAKALVFLPMAISLVGASIIWKFVYDYRGTDQTQIGLANQILKSLGLDTYRFILTEPYNNLFLIIIMVWVQVGFAMTVLSAAIKAIPDDIVEAARLDGVNGVKMFRFITVPSIRSSLIVVVTTISITSLKVFDIVRTMTGGNFNTSVLANEFYTQSFRSGNPGLGAALGTLIFILILPIVIYNVRQMRKLEAR